MANQNKQIVVLYVASILGLLAGVFSSVINTRFLSPESYGNFRYIQNIIAFVSSLMSWGFFVSGSRQLALSKDEYGSRKIRGVLVTILGVTILIIMLVMLILYFINVNDSNGELSLLYLAATPVCGAVLMLNYINTTAQGDNHIGRIAIARFLPSAIYILLAYLIFYHWGATSIKMLLLYNGVAMFVLLWLIISTKPSFKDLKASFTSLYNENKSYGFNVYLGSLVGVSTQYIAGISLGKFCDDNILVGFYTLAIALSSPLLMLPTIVGTSFFKRFVEQNRIDNKVFFGSLLITILSCVIFIAIIKYVVCYMYSESYAEVSVYAAWLAIGVGIHGMGDLLNRFLGAHGQGEQLRNAAIVCGVIMTVGSIVLVYCYDIVGAIITKNLGSCAYFITLLWYYMKFVKFSANNCK